MVCKWRSRKKGTMDREEDGDLAEKGRIEGALIPFQAYFRHEEFIGGGGIGKESRKGTGLWHGYIGKEVVERPAGRESMAFAASSQRIGSTQPFLPGTGSVVECGFR
jgi:hypothetical protein